jgi:hypothetical protein
MNDLGAKLRRICGNCLCYEPTKECERCGDDRRRLFWLPREAPEWFEGLTPLIELIGAVEEQARQDIEEIYSTAMQKRIACERGKRFFVRRQMELDWELEPMDDDEEFSAMWWLANRSRNPNYLNEMVMEVSRYRKYCKDCGGGADELQREGA